MATDAGSAGRRTRADDVTARIRQAIVDDALAPGARIRQEDIATMLGTSRIPVREALRQLQGEGLVVVVPHSGAHVAQLDLAELSELYTIREAIEPVAIGASAAAMSDEQLGHLRALYDRLSRIGPAAGEDWLEADRCFHLATFASARMPALLALIEGYWNRTQHHRRAYMRIIGSERRELIAVEHRLLMDALERRDANDAALLQALHVRRTRIAFAAPEPP
jgi:DNA-binding GntR family transcriptional regulator